MHRNVFIRGVGCTPVYRRRGTTKDTFESLSRVAISNALADSGVQKDQIDAIYVGNMLAPVLQSQSQVAALVASRNGFSGIDTLTVDAACGSGGAVVRCGVQALLSGFHKNVLVLGVELLTASDLPGSQVTRALAQASDWENEGSQDATFMSLNDTLMQMYVDRYKPDRGDFFHFSENAHRNASHNPNAALRKPISRDQYEESMLLGEVVNLMDACPTANGCAAMVLSTNGVVGQDVRILGSDCRTDPIQVSSRKDPLAMDAVCQSTFRAMSQAGIECVSQVDIVETHDAYSIMSVLSLEACGFVPKGQALQFAKDGGIAIDGPFPINTFGGLKARGHPVGATGVYQMCELHDQLKYRAPPELQVDTARRGLTHSFGGAATTVVSHVLGL